MSAPAAMAASSPGRSTTSTSILSIAPACARARRTASATPPQAATWLSLMRIPSPSANRWFLPPPARTAAFSSMRQPGVVLRVSRRRVRPPPAASASAQRRVAVATPERRCRKLSAVRSAGEERSHRPHGDPDHLAARRPCSVRPVEPALGTEALEDPDGDGGPGEGQLLLDEERPLTSRRRVDCGLARHVAEERSSSSASSTRRSA